MITMDPLFFLVLIELIAVLAGAVVYFAFQGNKNRRVYLEGIRNLELKLKAQEELMNQSAAGTADAVSVSPPADTKELEDCKKEVIALTETLKEKNKLFEDLQKKMEGVEKEYIILYQESMKNQVEAPGS